MNPTAISTKQCHIRAANLDDLTAIEHALAMPQFPRKLPLSEMHRNGRISAWLERFCQAAPDGKPQLWSIDLPATRCVGQVALVPRPEFEDYALSFWLNPTVWGRGLAREAVSAVLADAFVRRNIQQVWAGAASWNEASANLLLALHFSRVSYDGDGYLADGEMQSIQAFALTAAEWRATNPIQNNHS